eukprot:TRINITY_DN777_c0_g1_i1.p1 TRINITY_DN777_c0_g1~~TRINITY_DN777_c0_g1_i1.p1  ORF type:complete len:113 (-),score=17.41 TRINITY_DN777_c0_g1_i1:131-469(-)
MNSEDYTNTINRCINNLPKSHPFKSFLFDDTQVYVGLSLRSLSRVMTRNMNRSTIFTKFLNEKCVLSSVSVLRARYNNGTRAIVEVIMQKEYLSEFVELYTQSVNTNKQDQC